MSRNHVHPFRVINNLFAVIIPATGHASIAFNSPCCFLLLNPGLARVNLSPIIISSLFTVGINRGKKTEKTKGLRKIMNEKITRTWALAVAFK